MPISRRYRQRCLAERTRRKRQRRGERISCTSPTSRSANMVLAARRIVVALMLSVPRDISVVIVHHAYMSVTKLLSELRRQDWEPPPLQMSSRILRTVYYSLSSVSSHILQKVYHQSHLALAMTSSTSGSRLIRLSSSLSRTTLRHTHRAYSTTGPPACSSSSGSSSKSLSPLRYHIFQEPLPYPIGLRLQHEIIDRRLRMKKEGKQTDDIILFLGKPPSPSLSSLYLVGGILME